MGFQAMLRGLRQASRIGLASVAVAAAALVVAGAGGATPPGQNGLISYRVYFDADHSTARCSW